MRRLILGVDPGLAVTGYGIIAVTGKKYEFVSAGVIKTTGADLKTRICLLAADLRTIIGRYRPTELAVEKLFFAKNRRSALAVGQARGAVLLVAGEKIEVCGEYTPLQVKQAITGYGRADKKQIQMMVQRILRLDTAPHPVDAADALAVAICHANQRLIANHL